MLWPYFLAHGRVERSLWLGRTLLLGLCCMAFALLAQQIIGETGGTLFALIFLWGALAIATQRLHDIGKSGTTLLLLLIPVLGPLWIVLLLCRPGVNGRNRYGNDPLSRLDYLRVDISK